MQNCLHRKFLEKRQQVENETQWLRMQEKLNTARTRAQILENAEFGEEQELQGNILGNHQQFLRSKQTKRRILKNDTVNKIVII